MKAEKRLAEEKEDFDLAAAFKVTIEVLTTLGEQIWMCDHEKQRCVQEEKYDQAKGFKIRRDEMKLRRDRQIDENLYQFGFSHGVLIFFFVNFKELQFPEQTPV